MPVPLPLILAAAAKVAQDDRTKRMAKSLFDAGSDAVERRLKGARDKPGKPAAARPSAPPAALPKPKKKGWRAALDRKVRFRKGASGNLIRFRYVDEHGLATQRMVGNWTSDGDVLTGFCINMKCEKPFVIGGIADWEEIPLEGTTS